MPRLRCTSSPCCCCCCCCCCCSVSCMRTGVWGSESMISDCAGVGGRDTHCLPRPIRNETPTLITLHTSVTADAPGVTHPCLDCPPLWRFSWHLLLLLLLPLGAALQEWRQAPQAACGG
jgi:hypothetical protein